MLIHSAVDEKLDLIESKARQDLTLQFNNLLHLITPELLEDSFYLLKREAGTGIDGVSWHDYTAPLDRDLGLRSGMSIKSLMEYEGMGLENKLRKLHARVHKGSYRPNPSLRIDIPKLDGGERPLGIPIVEDKILERAVVTILEKIYEMDFLDFSYGFRPNREPGRAPQKQALDRFCQESIENHIQWVVDADIRGFFDNVVTHHMMEFLRRRIADPRLLALIESWLKAGVIIDGEFFPTNKGTPQGGVISPLLGNIYLHYALDLWIRSFDSQGAIIPSRYADDFITGFHLKEDAERYLVELRKQLDRYGLTLHPGKTHVIRFSQFAPDESFVYLGMEVSRRSPEMVRYRFTPERAYRKLRGIAMEAKRKPMSLDRWAGISHGVLEYYDEKRSHYFDRAGSRLAIAVFRNGIRHLQEGAELPPLEELLEGVSIHDAATQNA